MEGWIDTGQCYALTGLTDFERTVTRLPHAGPGYNMTSFQPYGMGRARRSNPRRVYFFRWRPMIGTDQIQIVFHFYMR